MTQHDTTDDTNPTYGPLPQPAETNRIRETYEEYAVAGDMLAMVADPQNKRAWLQTEARHVERVEP